MIQEVEIPDSLVEPGGATILTFTRVETRDEETLFLSAVQQVCREMNVTLYASVLVNDHETGISSIDPEKGE